ncbi:MAG: glycosyltransferase [Candidatus Scalindua sp. AMX11]|nr:MAG: glycosyltransferase [Candidatus Scalindua sp.]NOG82558.1 glycosyltransferase [Planctomycetota bacterium]RZV93987.1 MAG: glycosyltransferase [Candidatus Scalindua sp. SCAELEC01]TDE63970.1 MAG: glycosyltransferase [Candidatus Scalindua sp. AMX11]GJQ57447.1 MAG: glycosyl transferase family 1 [Candidatus Scalindua sp.]
MIKVCYIIGQLTKGGAEGQIYQLVKHLDRRRFCPTVISLSQGGYWAKEIRKLNIQVVELQRRTHKEFTRLFKLVKLLKDIKPDIVHTQLFSANTYGRVAAIIARVPIIIGHELSLPVIGKDKKFYQICIEKFLSMFSQGIICNSAKVSDILVKKHFYSVSKIFIVHNGVVITDFQKQIKHSRKLKTNHKTVGIVARLDPAKNQRLFLDMANIILSMPENKSTKFLIVGDGPLKKELEEYSRNLGIEQNVIFTGERSDIPELLQEMDIFVMTSLFEGIPNAIMEAMLAGLPIVSTDVGAISEVVIDGENGFLCPSHDSKNLADKVIRLIKDEEEARSMGESGKKMILNAFGIEKMTNKIEDVYKKLLEKKCIIS